MKKDFKKRRMTIAEATFEQTFTVNRLKDPSVKIPPAEPPFFLDSFFFTLLTR